MTENELSKVICGKRPSWWLGWVNRKGAEALGWDGGWWVGWDNRKDAKALSWDGGWWLGWDNRKGAMAQSSARLVQPY